MTLITAQSLLYLYMYTAPTTTIPEWPMSVTTRRERGCTSYPPSSPSPWQEGDHSSSDCGILATHPKLLAGAH